MEVISRKALVIGNAAYKAPLTLRNPVRDAELFAQSLTELGFAVTSKQDVGIDDFVKALSEFVKNLNYADAGVFYYAGHGAQVAGENFLIPVDCDPVNALDLELGAVKLQTLLTTLGNSSVTSVFFLDCCRTNPLPRWAAKGPPGRDLLPANGLAAPVVPNGSFVAFATMNDAVAEDGEGDHSVFSASLSEYIKLPDASISNVMAEVRGAVRKATHDRQIPMDWLTLVKPFVFNRMAGPIRDTGRDREDEYWSYVKDGKSLELLESFQLAFPSGKHREEANKRIDELKRARWSQNLRNRALYGIGLAAAFALFLVMVGWMQFDTIEGKDLIGGDIYLPVDVGLKDVGPVPKTLGAVGCRLACIFTPSCVAFTFDKANRACYLKNDFENSDGESKGAINLISGWVGQPLFTNHPRDEPKDPKIFKFDYDRLYDGPVLNADGSQLKYSSPPSGADRQFGPSIEQLKNNWPKTDGERMRSFLGKYSHGFTFCQALCADLEECGGFSYSTLRRSCKLIAGEPKTFELRGDTELTIPGMISGKRKKN